MKYYARGYQTRDFYKKRNALRGRVCYTPPIFPSLVMRTRSALLALAYSMTLLPTAAFAVTEADLTETEKKAIFRPCLTVDSDAIERCKTRQLARLKITTSGVRGIPTNAQDLYERMDLGGAKRRIEAQRARLIESRDSVKGRKTYREYDPATDANVAQASYVGDLRAERLKCQLESPGRPRALCFDRVAQKYRKIMQENSGSKQEIAK